MGSNVELADNRGESANLSIIDVPQPSTLQVTDADREDWTLHVAAIRQHMLTGALAGGLPVAFFILAALGYDFVHKAELESSDSSGVSAMIILGIVFTLIGTLIGGFRGFFQRPS